jgi:hypothetical protein
MCQFNMMTDICQLTGVVIASAMVAAIGNGVERKTQRGRPQDSHARRYPTSGRRSMTASAQSIKLGSLSNRASLVNDLCAAR